MDCGSVYIKMCEKAVEIQKEWEPQEGDVIKYKFKFKKHPIKYDEIQVLIDKHPPYIRLPYFCRGIGCSSLADLKNKVPSIIWLPRQDQLQEMVYGNDVHTILTEFEAFYTFPKGWGDHPFNSMEQLWLAFVMKEKYGKIWDGDKWIKPNKSRR